MIEHENRRNKRNKQKRQAAKKSSIRCQSFPVIRLKLKALHLWNTTMIRIEENTICFRKGERKGRRRRPSMEPNPVLFSRYQ